MKTVEECRENSRAGGQAPGTVGKRTGNVIVGRNGMKEEQQTLSKIPWLKP